jgi:poly(hydroxyalkanoate) depolymerase family esterase
MPRAVRLIVLSATLLVAGFAAVARPAYAATLTSVSGFGGNPGNLGMYAYHPDGLPAGAPLVVALHGCSQNASDYYTNAGWKKYADLWRFAVVFPEQKSANNILSCFNWFEPADTARGQGEALSIKQMVDYAVGAYGSDPARVFVTGLSAGGAMTAVLLATYPDVFAGGAVMAGVPYGCATTASAAWTCMSPGVDRTPAAWGDQVRAAYPGYPGRRPKVSIWHGTADTRVVPANATELRDQWTNVLGVPATPTAASTLPGGTALESYGDVVRVYRITGMTHATAVDPGGAVEQCGTAGTYYKDTICSAYYTALDWGIGTGTPPSPTAPPTGICVRDSNYGHVAAGRAHQSLGQVYANGSNEPMGLYNLLTAHGLRQTGTDYWVLADADC